MSLDLGFGHVAPQFQDVEIQNDEEDLINFGPNILSGESNIHGGYLYMRTSTHLTMRIWVSLLLYQFMK